MSQELISRRRLQELVQQIDPREKLDPEVEELLLDLANDFIDNVARTSSSLAQHRKSETLEVKDVKFNLENQWNIRVPGFGSEEAKPYKKQPVDPLHKQRMALVKRTQTGAAKAAPK
eukprot:GILJ01010978.1.p1 GENE.GILJ01010978.1~~GILJ01010978.1.p1  ORF type:complete len:117 (-),score=17.83 GILJ01010978.1:129-479(-)